jgi:hypothetical protein
VSVTEAVPAAPGDVADANAVVAGADQDSDAAQAAKSLTVRSIMGRVGHKDATMRDTRSKLVDEHAKELRAYFDEQRAATKAALTFGRKSTGLLDPEAWNRNLASRLTTLSTATAQALGSKTAKSLGGTYSPADITPWIAENAKSSAAAINQATDDEISTALESAPDDANPEDVIDDVFGGEISARADQISLSRVAVVGGLALLAAARQNDAESKTWVVTSGKPRASHAQMDGETVPLGESFSNGMNGPGDPSGGADEVAGCTCELSFGKADS